MWYILGKWYKLWQKGGVSLDYTGHPLIDVGIATITAFARKRHPRELELADLDAIADYMEQNYSVQPLKSFLTVVFPNSGFVQSAYDTQPEKREMYAKKILRAYRPEMPRSSERCIFTGEPAVAISLDVKDELTPGRAYRQHLPLITGEGVINYHPDGEAGLPISGEALLAIHALPLGCGKVAGRILAVHATDPDLTLLYVRGFLRENLRGIQRAQDTGSTKLPEAHLRSSTLLIDWLQTFEAERQSYEEEGRIPPSITAYHLTNSGQGAELAIYQIPMEITDFLHTVTSPVHKVIWGHICQRGWEIAQVKSGKRSKADSDEEFKPRYNVLYDDLLRLPQGAARFIRRYFLRIPDTVVRPGDPRSQYSQRAESDLISWQITELFLRKVMHLDLERINQLRQLGDALADYIVIENDIPFLKKLLRVDRYANLRAMLINLNATLYKQGRAPVIGFDAFVSVFELAEDVPYTDWRLARDLVLIRLIEVLAQRGCKVDDLPELDEQSTVSDGTSTMKGEL